MRRTAADMARKPLTLPPIERLHRTRPSGLERSTAALAYPGGGITVSRLRREPALLICPMYGGLKAIPNFHLIRRDFKTSCVSNRPRQPAAEMLSRQS